MPLSFLFFFFAFLCFLLVTLLFKIAPKHSAEVLSRFPKCKKAVMCHTEKIHVFDDLCSGVRYSAVGYKFVKSTKK